MVFRLICNIIITYKQIQVCLFCRFKCVINFTLGNIHYFNCMKSKLKTWVGFLVLKPCVKEQQKSLFNVIIYLYQSSEHHKHYQYIITLCYLR